MLLSNLFRPKAHKKAPPAHNSTEKVAESPVATVPPSFWTVPTPTSVTHSDSLATHSDPFAPALPPATPAKTADSDPEVERLHGMITQMTDQLQRMEAQGRDVAQLRKAAVYLSNDPLRYRTPHDPRFRPFSLLTTDALRLLVRTNDIAGRCVTHLKSEVVKVPLKVTMRDSKDKSRAGAKALDEAKEWLKEKGGIGGDGIRRSVYEAQIIDDILAIGAQATFFDYKTLGERFDGKPSQVRAIDAATIQPLVNEFGFPVGDDGPAFAQWVQGVRVTSLWRDELIYEGLPSFARSDSPYFLSPTEQAAIQTYTLMRVDEWNQVWLTDGSGYRRWIKLNDNVTPDQAVEWLEIMKLQTTGNAAERQGLGIIPGEVTGDESRKDQDFDGYEKSRIDRICACYGVNPASIGFHSRQYKDSQENAMDSTREGMVTELLAFREDLYNRIFERRGWDFLEVTEDVPPPNESPAERSSRQGKEIADGVKSINQIRKENGDERVEGGDELLVPSSLQPLSQLLAAPPAPGGFDEDGNPIDGQNPGQNPLVSSQSGVPTSQAQLQKSGDKTDDNNADKTERVEGVERGSKYKFGCVMVDLSPRYQRHIENWLIPFDFPLAADGIETQPHITLLYGLHTTDPDAIANVYRKAMRENPLIAQGRLSATVGSLMIFRSRNKEGQADYDVLVHKVDSPDLHEMNGRLQELEHTSSFPDYKPHITLAYVEPGVADWLEGKPGPLTGQNLTFDALVFSTAEGQKHVIEAKYLPFVNPSELVRNEEEVKRALGQWERKCLNRLERGKAALVAFESDVITSELADSIELSLAGAQTKEDVKTIFRQHSALT